MRTTTSSSILVKGKTILLFSHLWCIMKRIRIIVFFYSFLAQFESRGTLLLWSAWRSKLREKKQIWQGRTSSTIDKKEAIEICDSMLPSILMSIVFMLSHPEMWTNCQYVVKPSSIIIRIIKCVSPTVWARLKLFYSNMYEISLSFIPFIYTVDILYT